MRMRPFHFILKYSFSLQVDVIAKQIESKQSGNVKCFVVYIILV